MSTHTSGLPSPPSPATTEATRTAPASNRRDAALKDVTSIVRERGLPADSEVLLLVRELSRLLSLQHDTGTIMLDLMDGGLRSVRFREEQRLGPSDDAAQPIPPLRPGLPRK